MKSEKCFRCVNRKRQFIKTPEQRADNLKSLYSGGAAQAGKDLPTSHRLTHHQAPKPGVRKSGLLPVPLCLEGVGLYIAACAATRFIMHIHTTSFQW